MSGLADALWELCSARVITNQTERGWHLCLSPSDQLVVEAMAGRKTPKAQAYWLVRELGLKIAPPSTPSNATVRRLRDEADLYNRAIISAHNASRARLSAAGGMIDAIEAAKNIGG